MLGTGAFSHVKKGRRASDQSIVAVKIFTKSRLRDRELLRAFEEAAILQELNHPNIVGYKDFFDENKYMCLVLEYMETDLYYYMNEYFDKLTEDIVRNIFKTIVGAIEHCH